jgi:hypothetical protein
MINNSKKTLEQLLEDTCKSYGEEAFSAYQVYSAIVDRPKKNGKRRHYTLTYSQVKQQMARAKYLVRIGIDEKTRSALYQNREI